MGLRYNTDFVVKLGEVLTKLSTAFDTLNAVVAKVQVQDDILLTESTLPTRKDLVVLYLTWDFFKLTYNSLKTSYQNTDLLPGPLGVTTPLAAGVPLIDAMLPDFSAAIKDMETVTSIQMFYLFPGDQPQLDLKAAFKRIYANANKYTLTYRFVSQDEVNAVISAGDQKILMDFYNSYLTAINEITNRFNIILRQYTVLADLQTALIKGSCPFNSTAPAWNTKILSLISLFTPQVVVKTVPGLLRLIFNIIIDHSIKILIPELKYSTNIVTSISKRVFSSSYDAAIKCVSDYQSAALSALSSTNKKVDILIDYNTAQKLAAYDACISG